MKLKIRALISVVAVVLHGVPASSAAPAVCYHGVNLSGAEYGDEHGVFGTNYIYPNEDIVRYFASKHMTVIRLPFLWNRLQPNLKSGLDPDELHRLTDAVALIRKYKMAVVLDPHNFGYYGKVQIGTHPATDLAFGDFWARLAVEFANQDGVIFGLMNEPHDIKATDWLEAANSAVRSIRTVGAKNLVLVPGTAWTGAGTWEKDVIGGANGTVMLGLHDPANNFAYEFHQYFDADSSGTHAQCDGAQAAVDAITNVTSWLKTNGQRGFLGEFGVSSDPSCMKSLATVLKVMGDNSDVWLGWSYWAAGEWWSPDEPYNVQPHGGKDRAQLSVLTSVPNTDPTARACALVKTGN